MCLLGFSYECQPTIGPEEVGAGWIVVTSRS